LNNPDHTELKKYMTGMAGRDSLNYHTAEYFEACYFSSDQSSHIGYIVITSL
jgi:hypothetical protein